MVRQGEVADSVFFVRNPSPNPNQVRKGRVLCQRRGSEDVFPVGEGECFGESALYADLEEDGNVRKADVLSDGESTIMQLQASEFQQLLGASLQEVAAANFNRKLLSAVKVEG